MLVHCCLNCDRYPSVFECGVSSEGCHVWGHCSSQHCSESRHRLIRRSFSVWRMRGSTFDFADSLGCYLPGSSASDSAQATLNLSLWIDWPSLAFQCLRRQRWSITYGYDALLRYGSSTRPSGQLHQLSWEQLRNGFSNLIYSWASCHFLLPTQFDSRAS